VYQAVRAVARVCGLSIVKGLAGGYLEQRLGCQEGKLTGLGMELHRVRPWSGTVVPREHKQTVLGRPPRLMMHHTDHGVLYIG